MQNLSTLDEAKAYVLSVESSWGYAPCGAFAEVHKGDDSTCGCDTIRVSTGENIWDVWLEDGAIYGEC